MRPPSRPLSEEVYDQLRALLGSESFARGTRLPCETDLALRFAVSRPVVRQALARLRDEGHVVSRKGSGSYVSEPPQGSGLVFGSLFGIPDMRAFLEFRCSLEGEAAAHAARRGDSEGNDAIRRAREQLEAAAAMGEPGLEEDAAFHRAIAWASGNRFFVTTVEAFREQMLLGIRVTRELSGRPLADRHREIAEEHARVEAAIRARDEAAARDAMTDHLRGGIRRLFGG